MKTMITLLASLLFIVKIANAQQDSQTPIGLPENPGSEQIQVDGSSDALVPNEMILGGQSNLPQGIEFQNKTSLVQKRFNARPRSEYNHNKNNNGLSRGQKVGVLLIIPGAIATTAGAVLIGTDDTKKTSSSSFGSGFYGNTSDQVLEGAYLMVVGVALLASGGITLLASSIAKSRR